MKTILSLILSILLCLCAVLFPQPAAFADSTDEGCAVILTQSWEEFAAASAPLVKKGLEEMRAKEAGNPYETARLIVKMEGELPDLTKYSPETIIRDPENHYLIQFPSAKYAEKCAAFLETVETVIYVEPDQTISVSSGIATESEGAAEDNETGENDGADAYDDDGITIYETPQAVSWGVSAVHADEYAADLASRGKASAVVVAVVDSGAELSHPMLSGRLTEGYDFVDNDSTPQDGHSHGTHVSGIVVDCTPGLNVYIMPVRVLNNNGKSSNSLVAQGIRYAAEQNAGVINLSLGGTHSDYLEEAIAAAVSKGITVVVAAGNDAINTSTECPAHIAACITVAAVDQNLNKAYFSNFGSEVDIAAPGVAILSAVPGGGYGSKSGTSMATPYVSAAAAMLLCDGLHSDAAAMLCATATDLGSEGRDIYYGEGFLNLESFIQRKYTVTYNANGGSGAPETQRKAQGEVVTISDLCPTRVTASETVTVSLDLNGGTASQNTITASADTSYRFSHWTTEPDGSGTVYMPGDSYTSDGSVTLYAQWTAIPSVTPVELLSATRAGYRFLGWAESADAVKARYMPGESMTPADDVTLYALWLDLSEPDVLPAALQALADEALSGTAIRYLILPDGMTSLGHRVFDGCAGLCGVYIPESVTDIAMDAFDGVPDGFVLLGQAGSAAESFASERNIPFYAD